MPCLCLLSWRMCSSSHYCNSM
uniref:Uncharacterized protein n=1 Tax=Anguilla anguilla TaxID=7936 RepID=A0A0E9T119_ANGAN